MKNQNTVLNFAIANRFAIKGSHETTGFEYDVVTNIDNGIVYTHSNFGNQKERTIQEFAQLIKSGELKRIC